VKTYFLILFAAFWLVFASQLSAQNPSKLFKKSGTVAVRDSMTSYGQSDIFAFKNLNKVRFYSDQDKLKEIKRLRSIPVTSDSLAAEKTQRQLYKLLREYVRNFGIANFAVNTPMIWELAKLSQKFGQRGEAVLLYKLVLKHHRQNLDVKQVRREFDTLTKNQDDRYIPLQRYYEIVQFRKEIDTLRPPQGVLLKMDDWVNSPKADYAPAIGNMDSMLIFTSKRSTHNEEVMEIKYDEDIFFTRKEGGVWSEAKAFKNINTKYNEGSACLTRDGKHLYFARCNSPDSHGNCDIFVADLQPDSTWGKEKNLGTNINTTSWDSHPSLSHSGDTLFFSSDRIGGFGLADIYYSIKDKNGKWGMAKNIGPIINTRGNEVSPFFHHKFNVLYFSSNGQPLNFGDFDIYKTYLVDGQWGEPKNIGPLVNGQGSEYYFTIDSESNEIYYARSEEDDIKNLDLHSFPVPMEAHPEAVATLHGSLLDSATQEPLKGIVSVIDLDHGVEIAPKYLRPDGSFDFNLINKRNYLLIIQGEDFFRIEEIFYMDGDTVINKETEPIESKIAFKSLEFEPGKANILPEMHRDLDKLANFLIDHPTFKLEISGHTDSQGSEDSNLRLSQARADAIKAYLTYEFKIDAARIDAHGYGSAKPIITVEEQETHRQLNRRVEFEIKKG
jgi:outer membrane protein OmpA-like peptidoglycan-associated protein